METALTLSEQEKMAEAINKPYVGMLLNKQRRWYVAETFTNGDKANTWWSEQPGLCKVYCIKRGMALIYCTK